MESISEKVLNKIKKDHITPKPKWRFLVHDYTVWAAGILSFLIGSLAFAVILFLIENNDWDVYEYLEGSFLKFFILTLPYFWIVFLGIFVFVTYYNFKHTEKGYKYELQTIVQAVVILSIVFGTLFYVLGAGAYMDDIFARRVPYYDRMFEGRKIRWIEAEKGFLAGQIIGVESREKFRVVDMERKEWEVSAGKCEFMPMIKIENNEHIRMIGEKTGESRFEATRILPIRPPIKRWFNDGFRAGQNFSHKEPPCFIEGRGNKCEPSR